MKLLLVAIALFGTMGVALADPQTNIPASILPTIKCIYGVLKSSSAIQSVDVYSIDGFRFGIEYAFRNQDGQSAVSYVELVGLSAESVFLGDKVPREVTEQAMIAGTDLLTNLDLDKKCNLSEAFDNIFPQPTARAAWRRIDLPKDFH